MGAKMVIPQAEADAGFGLLKDIVEMVKNPKAIEEAYEARRKGAQLTDDEVAKAAAARALIAQADAVREELKQKESALQAKEIAHGGNVFVHQQNVEKDNKRLNEWEQRLIEKQKTQEQTDARHVQERADLNKKAKDMQDERAVWEINKKSEEEALTAKKVEQELADKKQAEMAAKLKAKAVRLAAEAQKDD